jgi:threonine/homoserine/homoserine lactone efflux protein
MVDSTRLLVFLGAAILLAIAPGPGMLYVLARTLAGGRREGSQRTLTGAVMVGLGGYLAFGESK